MTLVATGSALHRTRTLPCPEPLDVRLTFGPLAHAVGYASSRIVGDAWWHAMNTPDGPVSLCVTADRLDSTVTIDAWGAGGVWAVDHAAGITGADDVPSEFVPASVLIASLQRRMPGQRLVALGTAADLAASTVLGQRVTTVEARDSWRGVVRRFGTHARRRAAAHDAADAGGLGETAGLGMAPGRRRRSSIEHRAAARV